VRTPPLHLNQDELFRELNRRENDLRQELAELEAKLRQFEDADRPAYDRWLRLEFGPELQDLETLHAQIRIEKLKARRIHDLVQDGYHPREARYLVEASFQAASAEATEGDDSAEDPQSDLFENSPHAAERPPKRDAWSEDEIEARRRAKRDAKREARKDARREKGQARKGAHAEAGLSARAPHPSEKSASRLTAIYRILVRKLHPDSPTATRAITPARARNLWHEVQDAYRRREADRLLTIATWLENQESVNGPGESETDRITVGISYSERKKLFRGLETLRKKLEKRIETLAADPAWEFSGHSPAKGRLKKLVRRQLDQEMANARQVEEALLDYFAGIGPARAPKGRPSRSASKKRRQR